MTDSPTRTAASASERGGPLITVAICTHNRAKYLTAAMRSVAAQVHDDTEVLVVDNASTDQTAALAQEFASNHLNFRYVAETRPGISFARNTAFLEARGQFVLFLDDDATAEPGWLTAYQKFIINPPSGKIAVLGGAVYPRYESPPPRWISAKENKYDLGNKPFCYGRLDSPWECNNAYSRRIAVEQGLFDVRLGPVGNALSYYEGAEFNLRLQDAGYEIWWVPGAGIQHTFHASRMNLRWYCRSAFATGTSAALKKLKLTPGPGRRLGWRLGRVALAPFHFLINLGVFLILYPLGKQASAVSALRRAIRAAGFGWQLLKLRA